MDCKAITFLIYRTSTSVDGRAAAAGSRNEERDMFRAGTATAETAVPSSYVEESLNNNVTAVAEAAASSLNGRINGERRKHPFGMIVYILPSRKKHVHKLSLPASMSSACLQENDEEGSCDESVVRVDSDDLSRRAYESGA